MGQGGVAENDLMPRLLVGYTEHRGSKWKKRKGFLKPNLELRPNEKGGCGVLVDQAGAEVCDRARYIPQSTQFLQALGVR